ncbi:MAG: PIN domain-containing protein [Verrucomicrobiae bacterium]|nr:PIN domain-containing protein [Verrucomicrobiae bacterium]
MRSAWKNETHVVLDTCALIAFLNDEPGAERVAAILEDVPSVEMSAINLLEIAYDSIRRSGDPHAASDLLDAIHQLPIKIHWRIDNEVFQHAARFKASFRISLADAFALALAHTLNAAVATSDHHEFDPLESSGTTRFIWIR